MPQPAHLARLESLYRDAAEATARGSKSFYFATRFFPPALARSAHAVYWFCRTTDDLVDEAPSPETAAAQLAGWEAQLRRALSGLPVGEPVLSLFAETVREHRIPHEYPLDLIQGVRMDLSVSRYRHFDELRVFCYRVASVVGLMMMHVIGYRGEPQPQAIDLGIAMQLTNILRDVGADLRMGRVYLPQDELAAFGYPEDDLRSGLRNDAFRRLMRFQIARARQFYRSGEAGIPSLDSRGRFAVQVAARVYSQILARIEDSDYAVFDRRAVVPAAQKYWITMRSMALPALRHYLTRSTL